MDVERGKVGGESYLSHTGACGVRQRSEEQLAGVQIPFLSPVRLGPALSETTSPPSCAAFFSCKP